LAQLQKPDAKAPLADFVAYFTEVFARLFGAFETNLKNIVVYMTQIQAKNDLLEAKINALTNTLVATTTPAKAAVLNEQLYTLDTKADLTHGSASENTANTGTRTITVGLSEIVSGVKVINHYNMHGTACCTEPGTTVGSVHQGYIDSNGECRRVASCQNL
jgi:hypothetical protein